MSSLKLTPEMAKLLIDFGSQVAGAVLRWRQRTGRPLDPEVTAEDIRQMEIESADDLIAEGQAGG